VDAAAQVLVATLVSKGVWGGAAAAGILAGLGKAVAGRTPTPPGIAITKVGAFLLAFLLASPAAAQVYIGAGASAAIESFDSTPGVNVENAEAWDALLGYRMSPHFAVEAQGQLVQAFNVDSRQVSRDGSVENWSLTLGAKVFPFEGPIQPFLAAGFGLMDLRSSSRVTLLNEDTKDWVTAIGGGVDFPLGDRFTLELAGRYYLPQDELEPFEYWSAGANVQYRF